MATIDIRFKRMNDEYQSVRNAQDDILDRVDTYEAALLGLTSTVAELNEKMDRLMAHLDVPPKPPTGFVKE